jgi:type IV pilus assembly protein PilN
VIRINLLPVRARKKKEDIRQQVIVYVVCVALVAGASGYLYMKNSSEMKGLKKKISNVEKEIGKHKQLQQKIKKLLKQEAEVKKKLAIINTLSSRRGRLVHMLDELSVTMPKGKMWFDSLKESGNKISMNGVALNHIVIADFMRSLAASPWIDNNSVNLVSATQYTTRGVKLRKFSITCRLVIPKKKQEKKT